MQQSALFDRVVHFHQFESPQRHLRQSARAARCRRRGAAAAVAAAAVGRVVLLTAAMWSCVRVCMCIYMCVRLYTGGLCCSAIRLPGHVPLRVNVRRGWWWWWRRAGDVGLHPGALRQRPLSVSLEGLLSRHLSSLLLSK